MGVDHHHDLPGPGGEHVARDVDDVHEVQARNVDAVDTAAVEVIGVEREALTAVGILADPTGAQNTARAGLEQRSLQDVSATGLGCLTGLDCHRFIPP